MLPCSYDLGRLLQTTRATVQNRSPDERGLEVWTRVTYLSDSWAYRLRVDRPKSMLSFFQVSNFDSLFLKVISASTGRDLKFLVTSYFINMALVVASLQYVKQQGLGVLGSFVCLFQFQITRFVLNLLRLVRSSNSPIKSTQPLTSWMTDDVKAAAMSWDLLQWSRHYMSFFDCKASLSRDSYEALSLRKLQWNVRLVSCVGVVHQGVQHFYVSEWYNGLLSYSLFWVQLCRGVDSNGDVIFLWS